MKINWDVFWCIFTFSVSLNNAIDNLNITISRMCFQLKRSFISFDLTKVVPLDLRYHCALKKLSIGRNSIAWGLFFCS